MMRYLIPCFLRPATLTVPGSTPAAARAILLNAGVDGDRLLFSQQQCEDRAERSQLVISAA